MNDNVKFIETLFEKAEDYSKTTIELVKLNIVNRSAEVTSSLAARFAVFMAFTLFTVFASIGIALWAGEMIGKIYYGFLIVGLFYVFAAILLYIFCELWLKIPISNSIIAKIQGDKKYKINGGGVLRQEIIALEKQKEYKIMMLKEQYHIVQVTLTPMNLIKNTVNDVASSPDIKNSMINNVIGLTTGMISKKILFGSTRNPIKKLLGAFVEFAIANIVSKYPGAIKATGKKLLESISRTKNGKKPDYPQY